MRCNFDLYLRLKPSFKMALVYVEANGSSARDIKFLLYGNKV